MAPPLQKEEQGRRHFALQLIPDVRRHQMARFSPASVHRTAAKTLEDSLRHYEDSPGGLAQEFVELKLQACIFQYDVCAEIASFDRNKPTGFAASLALKGLVLRLYEYDQLVNSSFIPRLLNLAQARGISFDKAVIKAARTKWRMELRHLRKWSDMRNQAAGHYGRDLKSQVALLKQLDPIEVMKVAIAFLHFNGVLLVGLRDVGKGIRNDA
jgi:hypothetical protein